MTGDREALGRLVRETWVAWAAEQPDPKGSWLTGWDELDAGQREVDMRIGHAVANYALTANAATYGISCASCAAYLDRANTERERAEAAEAKLAEVRAVLLEGGQGDATARCRAIAIVGTGETQDRSDEKEAQP